MSSALVEIEEVICENDCDPIRVKFENNDRSQHIDLKYDLYENSKKERILAASTDSIFYTGKIDSSEDLQYNFLVLRKKNSNKVRLVNLNTVFLRPYMKRRNVSESSREDFAKIELLFGSKRTRRIIEQREKLRLNIENMKEQLEETVSAIKTDDILNASVVVSRESSYVPPINRNASTIEEVYQVGNLIPQNILDSLETEVNLILQTADIDKLQLSNYCKKGITDLKNKSSMVGKVHKCKIFVYINYLLIFLNTSAQNIGKLCLCKTSQEVNSDILNKFSIIQSGRNRTRPMYMKDKTICYILVLAMLAGDYNVDLELLFKDVKVGFKKLQRLCKVLAFKMCGPKLAVLKFPLPVRPVKKNKKTSRVV